MKRLLHFHFFIKRRFISGRASLCSPSLHLAGPTRPAAPQQQSSKHNIDGMTMSLRVFKTSASRIALETGATSVSHWGPGTQQDPGFNIEGEDLSNLTFSMLTSCGPEAASVSSVSVTGTAASRRARSTASPERPRPLWPAAPPAVQ